MSNRSMGAHVHTRTGTLHSWVCQYEANDDAGEIRYLVTVQKKNSMGVPLQTENLVLFDPKTKNPEDALVESIDRLIDSTNFDED